MNSWQNYLDLFSAEMQPVISELISTYVVQFEITEYSGFEAISITGLAEDLATLASNHDFLLALSSYYLELSSGVSSTGVGDLSAWEIMFIGEAVEDQLAFKSLQDYLASKDLGFAEFRQMSATSLSAEFGGAHAEYGFWSNFAFSLDQKRAILADTKFGDFIQSLPLADQVSTASFLRQVVEKESTFDMEAFRAIDRQALAGKIWTVNVIPLFRYRVGQSIILSARNLVSENCPDDQFEARFLQSLGNEMAPGLSALLRSLLADATIGAVQDIAGLGLDVIPTKMAAWKGGHGLWHALANRMLLDLKGYTLSVAEQNRVIYTPFTFQIRPTNTDARPLGGLLVKVSYPDPVTMDPIVIGTRMLDFNGIAYLQYEGTIAATLDLTFEVKTADEELLVTSDPLEFDPATEKSIEVELIVPALPVNSAVISLVATALALTIPAALSSYLAASNLVTLDDLRRMGGLAKAEASAVTENLALCVQLDNHAKLELISDDAGLREFLIGAGYTTPSTIAAKTRVGFVTELVGEEYGEVTLAGIYLKASKVDAILGNLMMAKGAGHASNYKGEAPLNSSLEAMFEQQCDCEECRSGVSPLAYLAALLDYGTKYITNGGAAVDVDWFQTHFHQAYCSLPANCAAVEKKVCQVRIAIEVVRQYMGSVDVHYSHRKAYLETTYGLLLNQSGVTADELMVASTNPAHLYDEVCDEIAERMGISRDQVLAFYLHSTGNNPTLTEDNLEKLFGFQSTLRNPFSDGLKEDDATEILYNWQFEGLEWGRHTDADGYIYVDVTGGPDMVSLYRDSSRAPVFLVGRGTISSTMPYTAAIVPQKDSKLFGRIEMGAGFTMGSTTNGSIKISAVSRLAAWRLGKQRARWKSQDWPETNTFFTDSRTLPFVDPDVMGPDDIRYVSSTATYAPIKFWAHRRVYLDQIETALRANGTNIPGVFDYLDSALSGNKTYTELATGTDRTADVWDSAGYPTRYAGMSWTMRFAQLRDDLASTNWVAGAAALITDELRLTVATFQRLDALLQKYNGNPSAPDLSADELDDVYDIAIQAYKEAFSQIWITEEDTRGLTLTPDNFWPSLFEPKEGKWNAPTDPSPYHASSLATPWIDPVERGVLDLPDGPWGHHLLTLWQSRRDQMTAKADAIFQSRINGTPKFHAMLLETLGALPAFLANPQLPFDKVEPVLAALDSGNATDRADALLIVHQQLFLSEDEFREVANTMIAEEQPVVAVSDDAYNKMAKVLVQGWRRSQAWASWASAEGIAYYWLGIKQKYSPWRSNKTLRKQWLAGLAFYSRAPMVEPDLIKAGDLVNPEYNNNPDLDNPAYVLWRDRDSVIHATNGWWDDVIANTFEGNLIAIVGVGSDELLDLQVLVEQNKDVAARLRQLSLNPQRLEVIAKLKRAIVAGTTTTDAETDAFHAIMLQVKKERNYGAWNIAERTAGIFLSPDYFRIPYANYYELAQYLGEILLPWRSDLAARRDWQDRVQSRIDQAQSVIEGVAGLVKATEDRVLIVLRDVLVNLSGAPGHGVEERGEYLTEKLFLDFRTQCCNETTRVAQAIETLQVMFFSIRTGVILDDYPHLMLNNDDWDDDWKWLGTYATWRSLMFVYLYPENVLMPSLKDKMSGKLRELMDQVRSSARFTPDMACEVLHDYEAYLRDMADLSLQATVTTTVNVEADGCGMIPASQRVLDFQFALGEHTRNVYLSTVDKQLQFQFEQSHWELVPGMEEVYRIVGATVYQNRKGKRYIYLFALKSKRNDQPDLIANRLNLETMRWESDLDDLKVDANSQLETWTTLLAERPNETDPIYVMGTSYWHKSIWGYGNDSVDVGTILDLTLNDRLVVYNWLDEEGVSWGADNWTSLGFLWMNTFKLVGAFLSDERFLCIMAAIRFVDDGDWHLGYHTFYHGEVLNQKQIIRVLPCPQDLDPNSAGGNLVSITPISLDGASLFNDFQQFSSRIRSIPMGPSFDKRVSLVKHPTTADTFQFYFNVGTIQPRTWVLEFRVSATWYKRFDAVQPSPGIPASSPQPHPLKWSHRSLGLERTLLYPSFYDISYIGPCYDYQYSLGVGSSKRTIQFNSIGREMMDLPSYYSMFPQYYNLFASNIVPLNEHPNSSSQATRASFLQGAFVANAFNSIVNRSYLQEAYYLLPVFVAIELQKNKHYEAALEVFRLVYDYTLPLAQRKIYYGLVAEESIVTSYADVMAWLDDPENPHTIAGMRANTYTRFTIFSIARCMLAMADQEFTTDSPESVPRARTLYLAVIELLRDEIYAYETEGCSALLEDLDERVKDSGWRPEWLRLKAAIAALNNHTAVDVCVNGNANYPGGISAILSNNTLTWEQKIMQAEAIYQSQLDALGSTPDRLCKIVSDYSFIGSQEVVLGDDETGLGMNRMSGQVGEGFVNDLMLITGKSRAEVESGNGLSWLGEASDIAPEGGLSLRLNQRLSGERGMYQAYNEAYPLNALRTSGNVKRPFIPYSNHYFCVPQNPVPFNLLLHAELNLFKIRHCRNIAGIHRELDPYGAPTDTTSGMPVIGANGQIAFPGSVAVPPTPYRYEVVLSRAKELVQLAAQAENAMLVTLEKLDSERYNLLRARQDLSTAKATVRLQDLRVRESEHEVDYAEMQQERAQDAVENYQDWIQDGLPAWEKQVIASYIGLAALRVLATQTEAIISTIKTYQDSIAIAGGLAAIPIYGSILAASVTGSATQSLVYQSALTAANVGVIGAEANLGIQQIQANWENSKREWTFQKAMSEWDVKLSGQQIKLANDRLRITGQERAIAQMQADHAEETLEFLRTKFTNADLYDWMSGVLQRVYSFYLQHATSMAKIAQQQLAFERQEAPANLILDDYWAPPSDGANVPGVGAGTAVDRRGLTGSARLQMDLTKLDLYSFETEKRKLQLTKTMSMAQLFPAEFEVFRQTGVLRFRTRMEWFDRDFPGHYLRLIKRVRTSVIALVPPGEGIRARLATTGVSRVVVGGDAFQTVVNRRGSESVSLTSPVEATGLFEMLPDRGDMLYPFEGMGVDAQWEFRMYKGANPLNFNTIADVMLTFEYTALENEDYAAQLIQSFDPRVHGERAFSFKYLFPDQWYDLRNATQTARPYVVDFELRRGDFPGLAELKVESVTVMLVTDEDQKPLRRFSLWKDDNGYVGGEASTNASGVASTRSGAAPGSVSGIYTGNAQNWFVFAPPMSPVGKWRLDCSDASLSAPASNTLEDLLADPESKLVDILLIVGYRGEGGGYLS